MYEMRQYGMGDGLTITGAVDASGNPVDPGATLSWEDTSGASTDASGMECAFGPAVNGVCPSASASTVVAAANALAAGNASAAAGGISSWLNNNASTVMIGSMLFVLGVLVIGAGGRRR